MSLIESKIKLALVAAFPPPYGGMGVQFKQLATPLERHELSIHRIPIEWVNDSANWKKVRRVWSFVSCGWKTAWSNANLIHTTTGSVGCPVKQRTDR